MIELKNIRKVFPPANRSGSHVVALDDVSVDVPKGTVLGVVGPSGSGKSTLARCVNLLERPTSGTVTVAGRELTALPDAELRNARRGIGMIFQHFNLLDSRTAAGNVEHPLQLAGVGRVQRRRKVAELLDLVGLSDKHRSYPSQLSGGQKQRVAIARALAADPQVLLSDEATSALDPASTTSVLQLLSRLRDELGLTILLITHEMDVVKAVCEHAVLLEHGRVVDAGPLASVATRPDSQLAAHLLPPPPRAPVADGNALLQVTVTGEIGTDSVLSILVRDFGLDVDLVGGRVETIGGQRFGRLQLEVLDGSATADDKERLRKAVARLQDEGVLAGVAS